jgi:hypothetical protein
MSIVRTVIRNLAKPATWRCVRGRSPGTQRCRACTPASRDGPFGEVVLRGKQGPEHELFGILHGADARHTPRTARDVDTGRPRTHAPRSSSLSRSALTSSMTTYSGLRLTSS